MKTKTCVEKGIRQAAHELEGNWQAGGCGTFAKALATALDIQDDAPYYCSYADRKHLSEGAPAHCSLLYGGRLYDSDGLLGRKNLENDRTVLRARAFRKAEDKEDTVVAKVGDEGHRYCVGGEEELAHMADVIRENICYCWERR